MEEERESEKERERNINVRETYQLVDSRPNPTRVKPATQVHALDGELNS